MKAIKLIIIMLAVLASIATINAVILSNKIENNPKEYSNARQCGQVTLAKFINTIK